MQDRKSVGRAGAAALGVARARRAGRGTGRLASLLAGIGLLAGVSGCGGASVSPATPAAPTPSATVAPATLVNPTPTPSPTPVPTPTPTTVPSPTANQAAAEYAAIAKEADGQLTKLVFWTGKAGGAALAEKDARTALAILTRAEARITAISWPDQDASAADGLTSALDQAITDLGFGGSTVSLTAWADLVNNPGDASNVPGAANALRAQLGLPAIRLGCSDCGWFSAPL